MKPLTSATGLATKATLVVLVGGAVTTGVLAHLSAHDASAPPAQGAPTLGGGSVSGTSSNGNGNGNGGNSSGAAKNFTITGSIDGLAPGVTLRLVPVVTNPNNQAIQVTAIAATVQAGTCSDKIIVGSWVGAPFTVPKNANTASTVPAVNTGYIPIKMDPTATDVCQSRSFGLAFTGSAGQG